MKLMDLTKSEKTHLRKVAGVISLSGFKRTAEEQAKMRKRGNIEPCWDCKAIARKLGLPV